MSPTAYISGSDWRISCDVRRDLMEAYVIAVTCAPPRSAAFSEARNSAVRSMANSLGISARAVMSRQASTRSATGKSWLLNTSSSIDIAPCLICAAAFTLSGADLPVKPFLGQRMVPEFRVRP